MSRSTVKGLANDAEPEQGIAKIVRELLKEQRECRAGGLQGRLEQPNLLLKIGGEDRFRGTSSDVTLWSGAKTGEGSQYLASPGKGGKAIGQGVLDATQSCEGGVGPPFIEPSDQSVQKGAVQVGSL